MQQDAIFTIGYGNRTMDHFIKILQSFQIQFLIDIRSKPYSKFRPDFNRNAVKFSVQRAKITYAFFGDTLGGIPDLPACYDKNGKIDYELVSQQDFFKKGITRLETAFRKKLKIALMCGELRPQTCHRSKLIGTALAKKGIQLNHIDEKERLKSQNEVILLITKGKNTTNLFGEAEV